MLATVVVSLAFSPAPITRHAVAVGARHAVPVASVGRREVALGAAALAVCSKVPVPAAQAAEVKTVLVAGATGQTGRRCLQRLANMAGVSAIGGVRDPTKASKKLSESKIEIRGAMIEKGAAIDASAVELKALDVEKNSVADMSTTLKGTDGLIIAVGFVPGNPFKMDAAAHAVLAMVNAPDAPTGEAEEETTTEEVAPAEEETETDPPNRSLTALNLSFNSISTKGRRSIEAAQAASEALTRVELKGNPCLTCGPTASLGAAGRAAIADTWAALAQLEGGAEGVMAKVLATALDETPAALPLVGYVEGSLGGESEPASSPSATPRDPKMPELSDGARVIIRWTGMARLAAVVATAIEKLIAALNSPPALERHLRDDLGLVLASRGFPPGAPYDAFGESLVKGLANALGEEGFSEEAAAAWREAYASASECMQTAYTLSQLAAANAPPAEEEAEAEAAEAECE